MGPRAKITYNKYGPSKRCRGGKGGPWANNVYMLIIKGRQQSRVFFINFDLPARVLLEFK